ncbi:hypothetical protein CHF27_012540 [Romboutsia maritimum]|uniref:DUF4364 family protein n=1 Tax=Romboutsia maritimum TaxID=2020948 RepID=A0A371IQ34_9FIRM|nr:ABC-three component system middle component 7 [Romboutsia maritimum]RDY22599.1 hypothetical protein CHF27_012540 [Romboutsia maritimum]
MIIPNKVVSYKESIIFKMLKIISLKSERRISINDLYKKVSKFYDSIDEFIYSLDTLYLLNCIDVDFDKGEVIYANRD